MTKLQSTRPQSMLWFDRLFLGSLAVSLAGTIALLPEVQKSIDSDPLLAQSNVSVAAIAGQLAGMFLVILLVWFCVSRLRSRIAKWGLTLFVAMFTLGVLRQGAMLFDHGIQHAAFSLGSMVLTAMATAFLHTNEARDWFAGS